MNARINVFLTTPSDTGGAIVGDLTAKFTPPWGYSYLIKHCDVKSPDHSGGFDLYGGIRI